MIKFNKQQIYKMLGMFFMVVGIIGLFLPVFPTSPFIILAAYFFFNSSARLFMFLLRHKYLGLQLYTFLKYRSIELRSKLLGLIFLWGSGTVTMFFLTQKTVSYVMFFIFLLVTIHIFSYRNLTKEEKISAKENYYRRLSKREKNNRNNI